MRWNRVKNGACAVCVGLTLAAAGGLGYGADFPDKPVRFVVGFTPGGPSDIVARLLGQKLGGLWKEQVIVDNRAGAGGNIAAELVAKAPGDGYTMLLGNNSILATNAALYGKLAYDPVKDFAPVILVASQPNILVVHPSLPVKSVKELIALAKSKPGQLNYASSGSGAAAHLSGELFKSMAHVDIVHIPYKGAAPALNDLIGGQVQLMFATALSVVPHIKSGRLRALGVTTAKRMKSMPELPTIAQAGVPGFEATTWHGIVVAASTPQTLVTRINADTAQVLQMPDVRERFAALGAEIIGGTPQEFAAYIRKEIPKWTKVIKASGARAD
jgi:tripartite-type tricarboxylate transporter receptor subunit TctC